MEPQQFSETTQRRRRVTFGRSRGTPTSTQVLEGQAADGRQVGIYRGLLPGQENRGASIGNFLILTADSDPRKRGYSELVIPVGSLAVRHPSLDSHSGRGPWSIQAGSDRIGFPSEADAARGALPTINGQPIEPRVPLPETASQVIDLAPPTADLAATLQ